MNRIALGIAYQGTHFAGWQMQAAKRTVQATVEEALGKLTDHSVRLICAGRTDAGVHAIEQVAHFDTSTNRKLHIWVSGSNFFLPADVRIVWAKSVPYEFDARYSAIMRHYRYLLLVRKVHSALLPKHVTHWFKGPLDANLMAQAAVQLVGEYDFSSFRGAGCQAKSPIRHLHHLQVRQKGDLISIAISANGFLYHMVRNIVGTLLAIGARKQTVGWITQLLALKDRRYGDITAPAQGLYLIGIDYPVEFGFDKKNLKNSGLIWFL